MCSRTSACSRWAHLCVALLGALLAVAAVLALPTRARAPVRSEAIAATSASPVLPAHRPLPVHAGGLASPAQHQWVQRSVPRLGLFLLASEHGAIISAKRTPRLALERAMDSGPATATRGYDATAPPRS